jgi:hypothetical protein
MPGEATAPGAVAERVEAAKAFLNTIPPAQPSYRPEAARDAWGRVLAFFAEALDPAQLGMAPAIRRHPPISVPNR